MSQDDDRRGKMWKLDQAIDQPLGEEAGHVQGMQGGKKFSAGTTLRLAFLSLGVVYGDLGTSPLYVFSSVFPDGVKHSDDVLGSLSLIIYTITLIPLIKYVFIALRSSDNGEGGTFALYSLICRQVKVNIIPNQHPTDRQLTTYSCKPLADKSLASKIRKRLERSPALQKLLLILVLLGTSMVIGDGMLSPAISVLSSMKGIQAAHISLPAGASLFLALVILVALFSMQRFGTGRVGVLFAPIILMWFLAIGLIGVYNIVVHDPSVFRALSPLHVVAYFRKEKTHGWISLSGVVLSITGAEALFADLGHFSARSIQIAFTFIVFPCLLAAYMGQAAYLMKYPEEVSEAFYNSVPDTVYWPMFVIATAAAIIASQATISATFSIIKQAVALGCFPRVKIIHTSHRFLGQIYIPEVNWILMAMCLLITAGFRETNQIGNAYGIAVVAVMLVTTLLLSLIMLVLWQTNLGLVLLFLAVFGVVESVLLSPILFKIENGGWVPLVIGVVLLLVMYTWHYGSVERYNFEIQNKVSLGWIMGLGPSLGLVRLPGVGLFYTELAHGVPSIFSHFLTHFPAVHSILMFVCVKYLPVSTVPGEERFLIRRIGPKDNRMYRCAVRYGYMDLHKKDDQFDELLFEALSAFIRYEMLYSSVGDGSSLSSTAALEQQQQLRVQGNLVRECGEYPVVILESPEEEMEGSCTTLSSERSIVSMREDESVDEDDEKCLRKAREEGVVHIMGNTMMKTREGCGLMKKMMINVGYGFLRKVSRDSSVIYHIPHESLLHVGMVYYV